MKAASHHGDTFRKSSGQIPSKLVARHSTVRTGCRIQEEIHRRTSRCAIISRQVSQTKAEPRVLIPRRVTHGKPRQLPGAMEQSPRADWQPQCCYRQLIVNQDHRYWKRWRLLGGFLADIPVAGQGDAGSIVSIQRACMVACALLQAHSRTHPGFDLSLCSRCIQPGFACLTY